MFHNDMALDALNTLRLPSTAQLFATAATATDVRRLIHEAGGRGLPITILGGGSNVVLRSRVAGFMIAPRIGGIRIERSDGGALVTAGAGVRWHELVRHCLGQRIAGIENLALIPGLVGAAPIQNIGAYGMELSECFKSLTAVSCRDGSVVEMSRSECEFAYRDSVFKGRTHSQLVIVSVTLWLPGQSDPRTDYPDVRDELATMGVRPSPVAIAEAVTRIRRRKLPDVARLPNAGSFFKNPVLGPAVVERVRERIGALATYPDPRGVKVAAARLIEAAGWKGRRLGPAGVWDRQPLVLINRGGACGRDMLRLAQAIRDDVADRFGVELELEPVVLGSDD